MLRRSRWAGGALLVVLIALNGVNCSGKLVGLDPSKDRLPIGMKRECEFAENVGLPRAVQVLTRYDMEARMHD